MKAIGSRLFFAGTMVLFFIQSTWLVFSARYPMAFDEDYHVGLIKLHAKQLSPFFMHQPPGPAPYGALTRDPSYLFQWLMSFPYRLVTALTDNHMTQIITLRLINVAMFGLGLWLFWLVLRKCRASNVLVNAAMFFFVLTPVVIALAAHINYDNMLLPLIAGSLLLTIRFREQLLENRRFDTRAFLGLIAIITLSSEVKFPYLPIMTGIVVYVVFLMWSVRRKHPGKRKIKLWDAFKKDWRKVVLWQKVVIASLAVVGVGLFTYTYGVNIIMYANPVPQCGQVIGNERCQAYGPWARNFRAAQNRVNDPNIFYFMGNWISGMFIRLFFVINGSTGPKHYENYIAPIMSAVAVIGGLVGLGVFTWNGKRFLKRDPVLAVILFIMGWYIVALWGRNYHDYIQLGKIVAVNGRYFVMVILPFYLAAALGWQHLLNKKSQKFKLTFAAIATVLFMQGGGLTSFLVYSNAAWYWPKSPNIERINTDIQQIVKPFVWAPKIT